MIVMIELQRKDRQQGSERLVCAMASWDWLMSRSLETMRWRHFPLPLPRSNRRNTPFQLSLTACAIGVTNVSGRGTGNKRDNITNLGLKQHGDEVNG